MLKRFRTLLPLAITVSAAILGGCHDASKSVGPQPDTSTTAPPPPPPSPRVVDLRFKGVGVLSSDVGVLHTDIDASSRGSALWQQFDSAAGSPLSLGDGTCSVSDCAWFLNVYALHTDVARVATIYRAGLTPELPLYTGTAVTDTVITSLDLQPAVGVFALSEFATSRSGGYHLTENHVALDGLQAAVSAEAAAKRVVTALAFDGGQILFLSYAWDHDTTSGYEARVASATMATAGMTAQGLAAEGYVVTALGGDPGNGFLLVGTRLPGAAAPRSLLVNPARGVNLQSYAVVGYLFDSGAGGLTTFIYER